MEIINGSSIYNTDSVSDDWLRINNCGYTATGDMDITTIRAHGRSDYLLLYVWHGELRLTEQETVRPLGPGSVVLYRPNESQHYTHVAEAQTQVYWLHFTGSGVPALLEKAHMTDRVMQSGCLTDARDQLTALIRELQLRQQDFEMNCAARITLLLSLLSRGRMQQENDGDVRLRARLSGVIEMMHRHCREEITIAELAAQCNLSEYHFIHIFRDLMGMSPYAYLTALRLDMARDLLTSTTMNISEVAFAVGYANPLYFSRLFHRRMGCSPSEYRVNTLSREKQ